ncbi:MAG: tetratricopeptide repeat protein, partial [Myxococcota bacterium]
MKSYVRLRERLSKQVAAFEQQEKQLQQQLEQTRGELWQRRQTNVDAAFDAVVADLARKEQRARLRAMTPLKKLVTYSADFRVTPDALFRLGQLSFEQTESDYLARVEQLTRRMEKEGPDAEEARIELALLERDFSRAIGALTRLVNEFPAYRHADAVYYLLGICHYLQGDFYDATESWRTLVRRFPRSPFRNEAWFRLGDYDFDDEFYPEAAKAYRQVASRPGEPFYRRALYKLAWSYYLDNQYMQAVDTFVALLDDTLARDREQKGSMMVREALQYIVKTFVEREVERSTKRGVGLRKGKGSQAVVVQQLRTYFESKGHRNYERDVFVQLGEDMARAGETEAALQAFGHALALSPLHAGNPDIHAALVRVLEDGDREREAMALRQKLVKEYAPRGTWMNTHAADEELVGKTRRWLRDILLALAVFHHRQGNEDRDDNKSRQAYEHYEQAAELYIRYLNLYPEWSDVDQAIFYLAGVTLEMGLFGNSIELFKQLQNWLWETKYASQAYVSVVYAYQEAIALQEKRGKLEPLDLSAITPQQQGSQEQPIPQLRRLYIQAVDEVLERFPEYEHTADVLFYTGATYYFYGDEKEAKRRLRLVVERFPESQAAHAAASLFVGEHVSAEQWRDAIDLAQLYSRLNIGGMASDYDRIELRARFKLAAQLIAEAQQAKDEGRLSEANLRYEEAAELYRQVLREGGEVATQYKDLILFNLAVALGEMGKSQEAMELYERVFREHPKSEYALPALFRVSLWHERRLDFALAAKSYLRLARDYPKSKQGGDALLNAAVLREADGKFGEAARLFLQFAERFPDRPETPGAYLKAAELRAKLGDLPGQRKMLQRFIKRYQRDPDKRAEIVEAHVAFAESTEQSMVKAKGRGYQALSRQRIDAYRQAVNLYQAHQQQLVKSPRAAYFAAQGAFVLMQPDFDRYQKMKINGKKAKDQVKQLEAKSKQLAELKKAYEDLIGTYRSAYWSAKALARIGGLYESLFRNLVDAPCPSAEIRAQLRKAGLDRSEIKEETEIACMEYKYALSEKANPVEEKALESYGTARERAAALSDPKAQELIAQLQTALNK